MGSPEACARRLWNNPFFLVALGRLASALRSANGSSIHFVDWLFLILIDVRSGA